MITYTQNQIEEVIQAFKAHHIIAFPTDTVYGVGVMYGNLEDLDRLKHCKNRPETKPIPMMFSSLEQIQEIAYVSNRVQKIIDTFLPGPLTLILPIKEHIDRKFTNGLDTIAIRIPEEDFILSVIKELNTPLFVTSANQSGEKTALTYEDVKEQLPNIDGLVLGTCKELEASTIVDCTKETLQILRPGPITLEQLTSC